MGISPHLLRAYELAREQHPHPNPRVGAVVVSASGEILGEGAHVGPGQAHAEVVALNGVEDPEGSTVYVSLEPCSHSGLTPPCTDRLIADRVSRVIVATTDPDPRVAGSGIATLREAGVEVDVVGDSAAREVDPAYFHHRETGMPLVTLKYAMTLDGSVAALDGTSQWITSSEAREDAHRLRLESDAVVVGSGTLSADDPSLDVRLAGHTGHQPRPVVLAGSSPLPDSAKLWERDPLVVSTRDMPLQRGELLVVEGEDRPSPRAVCVGLADAGYLSILLEGGPTVAGAWWEAGVIGRGVVYVGARVAGGRGMAPLAGVFDSIGMARDVTIESVQHIGDDLRVDFGLEP